MTQPAPIFTPGDRVRVTALGLFSGELGAVTAWSPSDKSKWLEGEWCYRVKIDTGFILVLAENQMEPA